MAKPKKPTPQALALGKRIMGLLKEKRLTQTALARHLGITRNATSQWKKGKSSPENERLRDMSTFFDVNYDWLSTGRGSKRGTSTTVEGLRLIGNIAAGQWHEVVESQDMEEIRVPVAPVPGYLVEAQYALRVVGTSLNEVAKDGAIITCVDVVKGGIDARPGDLVCVERRQGSLVENTVKRLRKINGALELWPESNDPLHQEKVSYRPPKGGGEVVIKAIVIGVWQPVARGS